MKWASDRKTVGETDWRVDYHCPMIRPSITHQNVPKISRARWKKVNVQKGETTACVPASHLGEGVVKVALSNGRTDGQDSLKSLPNSKRPL